MNKWVSDQYAAAERKEADQRRYDEEFARTGVQQYMGQGSLSEAYSNMHRQDAAKREADIEKMLDIIGGIHSVDRIVAKLYDAGYRKP